VLRKREPTGEDQVLRKKGVTARRSGVEEEEGDMRKIRC
jgi:hypothetical protein